MNAYDGIVIEGLLAAEEAQLRARKAAQDEELKRRGLVTAPAKPVPKAQRLTAALPPKRADVRSRLSGITIVHRDGRREPVDSRNPGKWRELIEECEARCAEIDLQRRHSRGYLLSGPINDVPTIC